MLIAGKNHLIPLGNKIEVSYYVDETAETIAVSSYAAVIRETTMQQEPGFYTFSFNPQAVVNSSELLKRISELESKIDNLIAPTPVVKKIKSLTIMRPSQIILILIF